MLLYLLTLLIATAVTYIWYYWYTVQKNFTDSGIKFLKPHIIFGNYKENVYKQKSLPDISVDIYEKSRNERYFGLFQFFKPTLVINDPDIIKDITVKSFNHFVDHSILGDEGIDRLWSKNVFAMTGDAWHQMRSTLSPAFTGSKMKFMFPLIEEITGNLMNYLDGLNKDVVVLELKDFFSKVTSDVIASASFGISTDSLKNPDNEFFRLGSTTFSLEGPRRLYFFFYSVLPWVARLFKLKIFPDDISNFFRGIMSETIKLREEKGVVRGDMVHLLLQAKKGNLKHEEAQPEDISFAARDEYSKDSTDRLQITDEDITAQGLVFFFAGHDTVSTTLIFILYELALNPDIQQRLHDENEEILGETAKLSYELINKMKYLDMVISEGMRKWPAVAVVDRKCVKDFVIEPKKAGEKPVKIKSGDSVWLPVLGIQRDERYYPEPEKFDPERFSAENKGNINPFAYLPFGVGPRSCIGSRFALMEIKTLIVCLLRKYEFVTVDKTPIPMVFSKVHYNICAEGGLWMGLLKRVKT